MVFMLSTYMVCIDKKCSDFFHVYQQKVLACTQQGLVQTPLKESIEVGEYGNLVNEVPTKQTKSTFLDLKVAKSGRRSLLAYHGSFKTQESFSTVAVRGDVIKMWMSDAGCF